MFKRTAFLLVLLLACTGAARRPPPGGGESMSIEAGSGRVVSLTAAAASVFAADPKVVEVRPASPTSLFLFGVAPGRTTVAAMSASGQPIAQFDVTVGPSGYAAGVANSQMATALPGGSMTAGVRPNGLIINGTAHSPLEADRAASIARSGLAPGQALENRTTVSSAVQVNLRVRVVEMQRNVTRELGVNWQAMANIGARAGVSSFTAVPALVTAATSTVSTGFNFGKSVDVNTVIDALAQDQLVHVLAEPNITAVSGEAASFLVGGEFPIPVAQFGDTISIEFKQYGVSLAFVPTVLTSGRISLHVRPEVSELTNQGAIQLGSGTSAITVPALQVRRADTTVELGSGQSFAIAGLMQDSATMTANGVPWLGDVPILGALFRSDSFQRNQTELVILVTPYLVQPASSPDALNTPDQGWKPPNDLERIILLRQKARGETPNVAIRQRVPGDAGFIVQ